VLRETNINDRRNMKTLPALLISAACFTAAAGIASAETVSATSTKNIAQTSQSAPLTKAQVEAAQKAWGEALISIAKANRDDGPAKAKELAGTIIDAAYGYQMGPVLFKPTLTEVPQTFRTTRAGALAYFVGDDSNFPKDSGFALKDWHKYEIENAAIHIHGDMAITMGKVRLTDGDGKVTEVDKTWGFQRDEEGALRIVLHHSSLPYTAPAK
jgi:hypothetical protein